MSLSPKYYSTEVTESKLSTTKNFARKHLLWPECDILKISTNACKNYSNAKNRKKIPLLASKVNVHKKLKTKYIYYKTKLTFITNIPFIRNYTTFLLLFLYFWKTTLLLGGPYEGGNVETREQHSPTYKIHLLQKQPSHIKTALWL
jgi:hypothetical protein